MVTIEVGLLVEVGIVGDKPPDLRIVIARADMRQPGVVVVSVAGGCGIHVGAGTAARAAYAVAEAVEVERSHDRLAAVGDRPLGALPVEQRHFAVFSDKALAIGIYRRRRAALLLRQDVAAIAVEARGRAACRAGRSAAGGIVAEGGRDTADRAASHLAVVVESQRVCGAGERAPGLLAVIVVGIRVYEAARAAGGGRQLVVVVKGEARGRRALRLAGAVSDCVQSVGDGVGVGASPRLVCYLIFKRGLPGTKPDLRNFSIAIGANFASPRSTDVLNSCNAACKFPSDL